jgi:hypothetical protein
MSVDTTGRTKCFQAVYYSDIFAFIPFYSLYGDLQGSQLEVTWKEREMRASDAYQKKDVRYCDRRTLDSSNKIIPSSFLAQRV